MSTSVKDELAMDNLSMSKGRTVVSEETFTVSALFKISGNANPGLGTASLGRPVARKVPKRRSESPRCADPLMSESSGGRSLCSRVRLGREVRKASSAS